ncbi:hypothetical protein QVD17_04251 [Tagetes erecta]|uniref:Uncharacterized protein n=1 Tax=Tagetes erecta TaxID=13708 RepID=A0AAD8LBK2_TARER|nr:hypothetical protein QVD17_04251 [Tagetes erecta]
MVKMDDQLQTHTTTLPLLSKPDRMESFMKHITRNPNISRWRYIFSFGRKNNVCVPLKTAVVETKTNNKSYLLDRIESLEDRLIQLSLEIETRRTSRASATTSTLSGTRELPVSSYPVFNNPKSKCKLASSSDILPISTGCELQNEPETVERKQKQTRKNGNKKKKAHSWPHLKILGC